MSEEQIHHLAQFYQFINNNSNQLVGVENIASTNDNNFIQYNIAILDSIIQSIASNSNMYQAYDWNQLYLYLSYKIHHIRQIYPNNQENFDNLMQSIDSNLRKFNSNPPFTLQRLCELLIEPNKQYKKLGHLLSSIEKCLIVNSYITDFSEEAMLRTIEPSQEEIINHNAQQILEEEDDVTMQDV